MCFSEPSFSLFEFLWLFLSAMTLSQLSDPAHPLFFEFGTERESANCFDKEYRVYCHNYLLIWIKWSLSIVFSLSTGKIRKSAAVQIIIPWYWPCIWDIICMIFGCKMSFIWISFGLKGVIVVMVMRRWSRGRISYDVVWKSFFSKKHHSGFLHINRQKGTIQFDFWVFLVKVSPVLVLWLMIL